MYSLTPNFVHPTGYYTVRDKIFSNKIDALKYCESGEYPHWNFQQDQFEKYDWTQEPQQNIYDLYHQRALDIRNRYEKVILYFSGGIDSTNMLMAFVDNNIPVDLIVSYGSFNLPGHENMTRNAEIYRVAVPFIKKLEKERGIKLPYYLLDDFDLLKQYRDESWTRFSGPGSWSPEIYTFNWHWLDPKISSIMDQGNTVFLRGIDKPRVIYENDHWYACFLDNNTTGLLSSSTDGVLNSWHAVEYFYWHGGFAWPLIKQCHMIKNWFKQQMKANPTSFLDLLNRDSSKFSRSIYANYVDPIVYGRYLVQKPGQERDYFSVGKPQHVNMFPKDHIWFQAGDKKYLEVWTQGIKHISQELDSRWFNDTTTDDTFTQFVSKGLRGVWSQKYLLE